MMLAVVLALYAALAVAFQRATPPLEASDEARHLGYVIWLQRHGSLPVADPRRPGLAAQEAVQPPLYYLAGTALVQGLDTTDAHAFFRPVPGSPIGRADLPGPRSMFAAPPLPTGGQTLLAVSRLRGLSIALGALTVLLTYLTVVALAPALPGAAAFAAALVALNPMFLFIASSVNNDNLVTAAVAVALWAASRPGFRPVRGRVAMATGAWIGASILAKPSGLVLLPAAVYRIAAAAPGVGSAARAIALLATMLVVVAGWWFVRNLWLYGEPLGVTVHGLLAGNLRPAWEPLALLREWEGFVKSFWGVFGAFNIVYPEAIYRALFALTGGGVVSVALFLLRAGLGRDPRVRALALVVLANLLAVALWTSRLLGSQGRLLFPSLSSICVLAALSIEAWPTGLRRAVQLAVPVFLLGLAAYACLVLIPAAYIRSQ